MHARDKILIRLALAFLWVWTGLCSIWLAPEIGYQVLAQAGIVEGYADLAVWAGACFDILLGVWVLSGRWSARCCQVQIALIVVYSALLILIAPSFWTHPFGPLSKNIPIVVLIWLWYQEEALRATR